MATTKKSSGHDCPWCGSAKTYRIKRRGFIDWLRAALLHVRPFWCEECGEKFYKDPAEDGPHEV
jgi:YgiT-type zinc finger domain-containing protein